VRQRRIDFEAARRELAGRCSICELLAGNPDYAHHVVYEDERTIAFLQRFQTLLGYMLVAPKEHREDVVLDFSEEDYLGLQATATSTGTSVRSRRACRSSSSQLAAIGTDLGFDLGEDELEQLAGRIRAALPDAGEEPPGA
jgi:hypothetical protein